MSRKTLGYLERSSYIAFSLLFIMSRLFFILKFQLLKLKLVFTIYYISINDIATFKNNSKIISEILVRGS